MSSLLVKRNGNRWLSEDFYNIRAFRSSAQKRNGGVGSMGSGDLSQCLPYLLSRRDEERLPAAATKPLARVWRRRRAGLPTRPLDMATHPHAGHEMPLEELLALYGYDLSNPLIQRDRGSSTLTDITCSKDPMTKELFSTELDGDGEEEEVQSLPGDLTPSVASDNSDILRCHLAALTSGDKDISVSSSDEEDSDSASIPSNDSHKDIMVGPQYQATIPPLGVFPCQDRAYESEDQLLWKPGVMSPSEVERFLILAHRQWGQHPDTMSTHTVKDNEQALYELVKCDFKAEEALRRLHFNVKVFNEDLCGWSEEERRNFEHGFRVHEKNFHLIQANKVRTRSVGECVEYYYLWKKSERHDYFMQMQQTTRIGRRRYNVQISNIDDGDQDGDAGELERSSSSNSHTSNGQSHTPAPSPDLEKQEEYQGRPRRKRATRFQLKP
ncbi:mesoderm induction early response protein 2 [Engraulis encrasicolus]|uniref:mesoderm induction early response protein 2 n=1 Tax=Engraulis encrasicolus TaxID=184585 RepID=UPI002FD5D30F